MQVNMSMVGQPNVTITMFNDEEDHLRVNYECLERQPNNEKRYRERRHFHIARDRLGRECGQVFPV